MAAAACALALALSAVDARAADLAIVIDDVGYSRVQGVRAIELAGPVTLAVLPFAPRTQELIPLAHRAGKPIILHQPMEADGHGHGEIATLTSRMSPAELRATLARSIAAVPGALGVSNHTGSRLTQNAEAMRTLMSHLAQRDLFFLDSRTTADTVAEDTALLLGVSALRRDVFLDHDRTPAAIDRAFRRALDLARARGHAVAIGHPHRATLDYLERALATLPADIELVGLDTLIRRRAMLARERDRAAPRISLGQ